MQLAGRVTNAAKARSLCRLAVTGFFLRRFEPPACRARYQVLAKREIEMSDFNAGAVNDDDQAPVLWDDLELTLRFTLKRGRDPYMSLFVPDELMYCHVKLHEYLYGQASWEQLVRCLPLMPDFRSRHLN